jgi:hypothetical protein
MNSKKLLKCHLPLPHQNVVEMLPQKLKKCVEINSNALNPLRWKDNLLNGQVSLV